MNLISNILIDTSRIDTLFVGGRGGKEKEILHIFPTAKRVNAKLYDYELAGNKLEIKKQKNLQWLDPSKYHNLADEDRNIRLVFVNHYDSHIKSVYIVLLVEFIDWLCKNTTSTGWDTDLLNDANNLKLKYPEAKLQIKAPVRILNVLNEYTGKVQVIYDVEKQ